MIIEKPVLLLITHFTSEMDIPWGHGPELITEGSAADDCQMIGESTKRINQKVITLIGHEPSDA
jgi:hypothetical protein